ncbi:ATP-binding protein [Bradyrhizobium sp. AZCC 2289]|uniref:ATP-binding protein n=1 Tax=Bradyrhizobium sp. AZCC 2289 TaxID=3117026 RepID=UPI002FEF3517
MDAVSFGPFRLYSAQRLLKKGDDPVKLGARAFDILLALVERAGEVVAHKDLIAKVWPNVTVEEISLRVHIAFLRKALDGGQSGEHYITNVTGRGYCFSAPVSYERSTPDVKSSLDTPIYCLPQRLTHMRGRDDTVRVISEKLVTERFVTIVGHGGMGKTTVALSVAHALLTEFSGAVCFVDLGTISDPRLLAGTVASAFGLPVQSEDPIPALVAHMRGKRTLLLLDSSEHLITEVAAMAQRLFEGTPGLHILATSRETLRAHGEHVYRLSPLDSPPDRQDITADEALAFPAVQVFLERVAASGMPIQLTDEDAPIVGSICRKLGGVALAIELTAGRVEAYGIRRTAELLDSQFSLLWPGRRTAPPRQQTLNATLNWSYNLLSDLERLVLRRLSVFVGGFALDVAQNVVGTADIEEANIHNAITELIAKSLASTDMSGPVPRYRLLDTTRTYASAKLRDTGESELLRRRHALCYRDILENAADRETVYQDQAGTAAPDVDNVRAALNWAFGPGGDPSIGVDLAAYSASLWYGKALLTEYRHWANLAAAAADTGTPSTQKQLSIQMALASTVLFTHGASDQVKVFGAKALELAISLNDVKGEVYAYLVLWGQAVRTPYYREAFDLAERCTDTAKNIADPGLRSMAEWMLGTTEHRLGRHREARPHLQRSLYTDTETSRYAQLRQVGYDRRTDTLATLSNLLWLQGLPRQAEKMGARAMETATTLGFPVPISVAKAWTSLNRYLSGIDIDAIENDALELTEHGRSHSAGGYQGIGLCILGLCQAQRGQYDDAPMLVSEGLKLLAGGQYGIFHPVFRTELILAAIDADRYDDALTWMAKIDAEDQGPEHWWTPEILRARGALALGVDKDVAKAESLFLQSMALAQKQGALAWELRTTLALSELWASRGRRKEALTLLPGICGQFTEGIETANLSKAQRLLGDLRSSA